MKRQKRIDKYDYITKKWPLFSWQECFSCGYEFRREWVWSFLYDRVPSSPRGVCIRKNACLKCCPNKETVDEKLDEFISERKRKLTKPPKEL